MSLTSRIKETANQLGFFRFGAVRTESFARLRFLDRWLSDGMHGEMAWMERSREKRENPDRVLPSVRSMIVVGLNYFLPAPSPASRDGLVSRYAWGVDYHLIMEEKLALLSGFVRTILPGAATRHYSDTGPVMEKAWAERAGLGWIGKHTNLISPGHGSYLFLGEILLDHELDEYSDPGADLCGTCTLCIQACPTGALLPYRLDARKCISYLNIEKRGEFSEGEKRALGEWVYGCDECQEVCPWNSAPEATREPGFRELNPAVFKLEKETVREEEFNRLFTASPIKRLKYKGLMRNLEAVEENRKRVQLLTGEVTGS